MTSLVRWPTSAAPDQCYNVAGEAFADAVSFLRNEFTDDKKALAWLDNVRSISIHDLLDTVRGAESQYLEKSKAKGSIVGWIRELSRGILHYGKVLDVLAQHHPEYVSLVWGATKFILMGIINHDELVERFSKTLATISKALPRAEISAALYRTIEMKQAVSSLYAYILLFLKRAAKWYSVGPARRVLTALFKPFELGYKDVVEGIEQCSEEIEKKAGLSAKMEMRDMHHAIARIETKLQSMQSRFDVAHGELNNSTCQVLQHLTGTRLKIDEIHVDVSHMRPRIDDMHFQKMLDILKPTVSPEQSLQSHKSIIRRTSPRQTRSQGDARILRDIGRWLTSPQPSLLVFQTDARAQARVKRIATEVIGRIMPESTQVIWYLSGIGSENTNAACTTEVLRTLVSQLMRLFPTLVRDNPETFNAAKLSARHSEEEWLELLCWTCQQLPMCFVIVEAEDVLRNEGRSSSLILDSSRGIDQRDSDSKRSICTTKETARRATAECAYAE